MAHGRRIKVTSQVSGKDFDLSSGYDVVAYLETKQVIHYLGEVPMDEKIDAIFQDGVADYFTNTARKVVEMLSTSTSLRSELQSPFSDVATVTAKMWESKR